MSNIDNTLAERGERYGEFESHAIVTQTIKEAMQVGDNWTALPDDMKECLEMIAHKIGRILNGDPDYIDSWTDIIGYARLVEKRLIEQAKLQAALAQTTEAEDEETLCNNPDCPECNPKTAKLLHKLRKAGAKVEVIIKNGNT